MSAPRGLHYFKKVIDKEHGKKLIELIDRQTWHPITRSDNSRKVQHYGYLYEYMTGRPGEETDPLPDFLVCLKDILTDICVKLKLIPSNKDYFNSCIVNDYQVGQGITSHTDNKLFGGVIGCFTLSLGRYPGEIVFTKNGETPFTIHPKPNSLYIMSGDSRYYWKHSLIGRKSDPPKSSFSHKKRTENEKRGDRTKRERRISVTFRNVI